MEVVHGQGLEAYYFHDDPEVVTPLTTKSQYHYPPGDGSQFPPHYSSKEGRPLDVDQDARANNTGVYAKKSKRRWWIVCIVVIIVILSAVGGAVGGILSNKEKNSSSSDPSRTTSNSTNPSSAPTSHSLCANTTCTRLLASTPFNQNRFLIGGVGPSNGFVHKAYSTTLSPNWDAQWQPQQGTFAFPPSVASWGTNQNRIDILGVAVDGNMYERHWDGGWSNDWVGIIRKDGSGFITAPSIASWGNGRLDVFAVGEDGAMYHRSHGETTGWDDQDDWEDLKGEFDRRSEPSAISWGTRRVDVVALGKGDSGVWHMSWENGWSEWTPLNGSFQAPPVMVSWGANRLDIFGLGTDSAIYTKTWKGSSWSDWVSLGGAFDSQPFAVVSDLNRIEILAIGKSDGGLWHKGLVGDTWGKWESLGGTCNSVPTGVTLASRDVTVFCIGEDGGMWYQALASGAWSGWQGLAGAFAYNSFGLS